MFVYCAWPRLAAASFLLMAAFAAPVAAQEVLDTAPAPTLQEAIDASMAQLVAPPPATSRASFERPRALMPLYASFVALQGLDVHSTSRGIRRGAVEANPLLKGVAGNPAALTAVKAASTAGIIYGVEKLRKKSRAASVILMIGINVGTAYVVHHNYRVASGR
jgi:hypothetical protein